MLVHQRGARADPPHPEEPSGYRMPPRCLPGEVFFAPPYWAETPGHAGGSMLLGLTQDEWQKMDERMAQRV